MKKVIVLILFFAYWLPTGSAQYYDNTLGLRTGNTIAASFKRFIFYYPNIQQAGEGVLGFQFDFKDRNKNAYILETNYHLHIDVGFNTGFSAFAGGGLFAGIYTESGRNARFGGGISGVIGMEYTFTHAPINISLDWKPYLGSVRSTLLSGGITLRYVFPTTWQ